MQLSDGVLVDVEAAGCMQSIIKLDDKCNLFLRSEEIIACSVNTVVNSEEEELLV